MNPWTKHQISQGHCRFDQVGPLKLWIQKGSNEWLIAYDHKIEDKKVLQLGIKSDKPDEISWTQLIAGGDNSEVHFQPLMPDRSVVVRPRNATQISKGQECVLYVFIPVWIRIATGSKGDLKLLDLPSIILSNTWFGDTMDGESCYALKVPAELDLMLDQVGPNRVICPVRIKNKSDSDLIFQRLCVKVQHLNIYKGKRCNWSNEVSFKYNGINEESEIEISKKVPKYDDAVGELLMAAREPAPKNLFQRTFTSF